MFKDMDICMLKANQVTIRTGNVRYFYSYDSPICAYDYDSQILYLNNDVWDYSNTTRKYFKEFLESYTSIDYDSKAKFLKTMCSTDKIITIAS